MPGRGDMPKSRVLVPGRDFWQVPGMVAGVLICCGAVVPGRWCRAGGAGQGVPGRGCRAGGARQGVPCSGILCVGKFENNKFENNKFENSFVWRKRLVKNFI